MLRSKCLGAILLCLSVSVSVASGEQGSREPIEVDLKRFQAPTADQRQQVRQWLSELQSIPLLAQRLAVVGTGEMFSAGKTRSGHRVNARQFAFSWCIDNVNSIERIVFADQHINEPQVFENAKTRLAYSMASELDRLVDGKTYYESYGDQQYDPSTETHLGMKFKIHGVFFPIGATTTTAAEIHSGKLVDRNQLRADPNRLVGFHQQGPYTFAQFEYRPYRTIAYFRVLVFEDGRPIQVEDLMAVEGTELGRLDPNDPSTRDREELKRLGESAAPCARTLTTWSQHQDFHVPVAIQTETLSGPNAFRVDAEFRWGTEEQIAEAMFSKENLGKVAPLAALP